MRSLVLVVLVTAVALARPVRAGSMFKLPPVVGVKGVTATSTFADKHDDYNARKALAYEVHMDMEHPDPVLWTAWCEGKPSEGVGETLTITLAEPTQIDRVRIAAGVWRTDRLFAANNQITALTVLADGKPHAVSPAGKKWVEVAIGAKVTTLAFRIDKVKKGRMNDSCISGIDLERGGAVLAPLIGVDAAAVTALQPAVDAIQRALSAPDHAGLKPLLEFPFSNTNWIMDKGYGGAQPVVSASWKELVTACAQLAKHDEVEDADPINTGCPAPANYDPDDDRPPGVRTIGPGVVELTWPSHGEVLVTWDLNWTDRWRLVAIGDETL